MLRDTEYSSNQEKLGKIILTIALEDLRIICDTLPYAFCILFRKVFWHSAVVEKRGR